MSPKTNHFIYKNSDHELESGNSFLTEVHGTRLTVMSKGVLTPPKTILAGPPWDKEPFPHGVEALLKELVPDINDQELFLFLNQWRRYLESQVSEKVFLDLAREIGGDILKIHDAAESLLQAIDDSCEEAIYLLFQQCRMLKGTPPEPYMPAHLPQELCRLIVTICEDDFLFEWAKAARDKPKGRTPMTRSGSDMEFVEGVDFWLEGVLKRQPSYTELQRVIDAFCGKADAMKTFVQSLISLNKGQP